jgi:UDP-GlcNAc:undecaprenyl-phosphate GlcNAc-1-phosphate transferase
LIAALATVTAGATMGFLIWNKSPARIYMGDAGALFLGVLLATLTLRLNPDSETQLGSYFTPIFLLAVPILDTSIAVISRLKRNISPFQGGQDHLSHRLIRAGLSRRQAAVALWSLSGLFGLVSILISRSNESSENLIVYSAGVVWLTLFVLFSRTKDA